ncbi:MAG: hypothetical protein KC917_19170 [Candidatus Omnitrophica bacterium]|nr:hypothetical protein [Candidatus Omnitrophota bacterium]
MTSARFARESVTSESEIIQMGQPFSVFGFLEERFPNFHRPLHRIFSQARHHRAESIILERIEQSEDIRQENEDLEIRCSLPEGFESDLWRVSFFDESVTNQKSLEGVSEESFLGYAIIKRDAISRHDRPRVYESVFRKSNHLNNYVRGEKQWNCRVNGRDFPVVGYLYAQQNNLTNVCAHVAVRTVATRFHRDGDMTYREMNQVLGIDHRGEHLLGEERGLFTNEIIQLIDQAGASYSHLNYPREGDDIGGTTSEESWNERAPYQNLIYPSIESGFPALLAFNTSDPSMGHVVPVLGHTFNEDAWIPQADFGYFKVGSEI